MKFDIDFNGTYFEIMVSGEGSLKGFVEYSLGLFSQPEWKPGSSAYVDFTQTDLSQITVAEIIDLSKELASAKLNWGNCKLAHVVARDEEYGVVRMFMQWVGANWEGEMRVYRSEAEARAWLEESD